METFHHLIDGESVAGRRHFAVIDRATGAAFAECPDATREEVDRAMAAAERAFVGAWPRDEALRRRTLGAMSEALAGQAEALGRLVSQEQGKPLTHAQNEGRGAARLLRIYAEGPIPVEVLR